MVNMQQSIIFNRTNLNSIYLFDKMLFGAPPLPAG